MKTFNVEYVETRLIRADDQPTGAITRDPDTNRFYCRRLPVYVFPFIRTDGGMAKVRAENESEAIRMVECLSDHMRVVAVQLV